VSDVSVSQDASVNERVSKSSESISVSVSQSVSQSVRLYVCQSVSQ
jgi:hypothetical protein